MPDWTRPAAVQAFSFVTLVSFIAYVLFLGVSEEVYDYARRLKESLDYPGSTSLQKEQDLDLYVWRRTLSDEELNFGEPGHRVLFVGDIHGRKTSLDKLLNKADFDLSTDHLIHTGDIVARGPLDGSLEVLDYMTKHNITGVRGNHDQMVIGWRAWIEIVLSQPGGADWLAFLEEKSKKERKEILKELERLFKKGKMGKEQGWKRIPGDWAFMGDHYTVARRMNEEQARYLRNLPLVLHVPRLHAFVVHAGLLPLDPRRSATSSRQPLSHPPEGEEEETIERLRTLQEAALLDDIPQNRDPWNVLNIRSILKDNSISKESKLGSAWAPLWNDIISRCGGFSLDTDIDPDADSDTDTDLDDDDEESDNEEDEEESADAKNGLRITKQKPLPCYPSTVVYGHAAARGLDIRRWSKGLDTGCRYGRRLTALVLTPPESADAARSSSSSSSLDDADGDADVLARKKTQTRKMRFGDAGTTNAQIVSVSCPEL